MLHFVFTVLWLIFLVQTAAVLKFIILFRHVPRSHYKIEKFKFIDTLVVLCFIIRIIRGM